MDHPYRHPHTDVGELREELSRAQDEIRTLKEALRREQTARGTKLDVHAVGTKALLDRALRRVAQLERERSTSAPRVRPPSLVPRPPARPVRPSSLDRISPKVMGLIAGAWGFGTLVGGLLW